MKDDRVNGHRIRCYDNGGVTLDRFTVVYLDIPERQQGGFFARGMNSQPFHGIGMSCMAAPGRHAGRRIALADLPPLCQQVVAQDCAYPALVRGPRIEVGCVRRGRPGYRWVQGWVVKFGPDRESIPVCLQEALYLLSEEMHLWRKGGVQ